MSRREPRQLHLPPVLLTSRLVLARPTVLDARAFAEAAGESLDDLARFLGWADRLRRLGHEPDELVVHTADLADAFSDGRSPSLFVWAVDRSRLLGEVRVQTDHWDDHIVEISYWMRSSCTGRGYASEAVAAVLGVIFDDLDAELVEAKVKARNARSRKLLQRLGFMRWGMLDDHDRFILLPHQWAAVSSARSASLASRAGS